MRKIKKINGFLVVKFNDREKREYEGTALGEYGVIDAEVYTGNLDIDRGAMEYDDADTLEVAVELARGLESEEDITDEPPTYTAAVETNESYTEETVEPAALIEGWTRRLATQVKSKHYAIRTTQAAQRVAQTIQRTQAIAQAVEAHPDLDYTKAASMVLMDGLMQRVSTAEDDFQEMPLDKAGRLIASLARNATYEKRVRQDMKKKAELAFEQMETELMAAIKQHPELAGELHDVLERAREKVLADGED